MHDFSPIGAHRTEGSNPMSRSSLPPAIVGIADQVPRKDEKVDYWELQIALARAALADAGLRPSDVDGVVFSRSGYPMEKEVFPTSFCECLSIRPAWMETTPHGGAQTASMLWRAANGLRNRFADVVLVVCADNRQSRFNREGVVSRIASQNVDAEFEYPYGPIFITNFALMAQRHMHEFGTTPEQFASVAVAEREWAALHPQALMQTPLKSDDVLASRMITSPLHLLDICLVTDGGGAAVMVNGDRAADGPHPAVHLLGYGDCGDSQSVTQMTDLVRPEMVRRAADRAFTMARLERSDVSIAYPYDPTTSMAIWMLEQIGMVELGAGGSFFSSGQSRPGGRLPCNTHGGLLSYAHPGIAGSFLGIVEAVRQLRGQAGPRQVAEAKVSVMSAMGGLITAGVNILGTADAVA